MSSTETLKDSGFNVVGYIEDEGNRLVGKNASFNVVGYYDKGDNKTTDGGFRVVGYGNLLASLIYQP